MTDQGEWQALRAAVGKVLQEGRLGRPSFARAFAQASGGPRDLRAALEAMTAMASGWFGSEAHIVQTGGDEDSGHLVALLRWSDGPSALLSVGPGASGPPRIDLILLGSRGAIYYRTPEGLGGLPA